MDGPADRDDVERAEAPACVFETAFDQADGDAGALYACAGGLDHRGLRVDADDLAAEGRKADRQKSRPRADVEKARSGLEGEPPGDRGKERRAVRRPGGLVIVDGGGEASHGSPVSRGSAAEAANVCSSARRPASGARPVGEGRRK